MSKTKNIKIGGFVFRHAYQRKDISGHRWAFKFEGPDGRVRARVLPDGPTTKGQAERAAKRVLRRLAEEHERGEAEIETLGQYLEQWLKRREKNPRIRRATSVNNAAHIKHHIMPTLGRRRLSELSPRVVRDWLIDLRDGPLKANSVRNIYATLKKALEGAVDEELLLTNPARSGIVKDELPASQGRYGGDHQESLVYVESRAAREALCFDHRVPIQRRTRWLVALTTGLREGELCALTWEDVDLDADVPLIRVRQSFSHKGGLGPLKTRAARRRIPLHPLAIERLKRWRSETAIVYGHKPVLTSPVFPSPVSGDHWRPRSAQHIRRDLKACGFSTKVGSTLIDAHATRRTFATMLAEAEVDEGLRRRLMGHTGASVTDQHYTAKTLARLAVAVAKITLSPEQGEVLTLMASGS